MSVKKHVVAFMDDGLMGVNNSLPWSFIKEDMQHFQKVTKKNVVIAGRKTIESIPVILRDRLVVGLTKQDREIFRDKGYFCSTDLKEAIEDDYIGFHPNLNVDPDICVIGGADIYRQSIELVDEVIATVIDCKIDDVEDCILHYYPVDKLEELFELKEERILINDRYSLRFQRWVKK